MSKSRARRRSNLFVYHVDLSLVTHHSSLKECHAGKAHTFKALRVYVLVIMQQLPAAGPHGFKNGVSRRQAANPAAVCLIGDDPKIVARIDGLCSPHQGQVLISTQREEWLVYRLRIAELLAEVGQVAADEIADRLRRLCLCLSQRFDHSANVLAVGRQATGFEAVLERADHQRHNPDWPLPLIKILQEHDLQLDRVFRQMTELVVEKAVAVVGDEAIDVSLIGRHDAERRLEALVRERVAVCTVMRSPDNDKERSVGALGDLFEAPGDGLAAALVVNVGQESGAQTAVGLPGLGQAGTAVVPEKPRQLLAQRHRIRFVAADARGLADGTGEPIAETRAFQEKCLVELLHQPSEKLERQKLAVELLHGSGLNVAQAV